MLDFFAQYATDPKAELEGKEFDWGGGVKLLLARAGNAKYQRMLAAQFEAHKRVLELRDTPEQREAAEECSHKIMAYVMAHSVLLGWTGKLMFRDGPKSPAYELTYSPANAEKLLLLKEAQKAIAQKADDFKNFRFETEEEDVKKSSATSDGSSNGVAV